MNTVSRVDLKSTVLVKRVLQMKSKSKKVKQISAEKICPYEQKVNWAPKFIQ